MLGAGNFLFNDVRLKPNDSVDEQDIPKKRGQSNFMLSYLCFQDDDDVTMTPAKENEQTFPQPLWQL